MAMAADNERDKTGIAAMIPKNSVGFFMLDTPWWYQNIINIKDARGKSILNDNKEFQLFEEKIGISLEKDIISWAGRAGVCLLSITEMEPTEIVMPPLAGDGADEEKPEDFEADMMPMRPHRDVSFAVLLEVRDHALFLAKLPGLMQKMPAGKIEITWKEDFYAGITVRRSKVDFEGMMRPIALAEVNGWLVLAVGDKSMEKIIDTVTGKSPSFTDIPGMKDALAKSPEKSFTLCGFNGDSDVQVQRYHTAQMAGIAGVIAFSETEKGVQISSASLATTDTARKELKRYSELFKPPASKVLAQLPTDTFAVITFCNPGALLIETKKKILASSTDEHIRMRLEESFVRMQLLQDILNNITGEFAFAGTWSKDNGVGIEMVGEHASAIKVADTSKKLKAFLADFDIPITNKNGISIMPQLSDEAYFPIQFAFMAKNTIWFAISSNVAWLKKAGPAKMLLMPAEAKGANVMAAADFSFLKGYLDDMEKAGVIRKEDRKGFDDFQLQKIQLICYSKINDDATSSHSICQINNWDWRNAIRLLLDENGIIAKARQKALQTQSTSNLKQLALAAWMLTQENEETLPTLQQLMEDNDGYIKRFLTQPGTELKYLYNEKIAGKSLGEINVVTNIVLFYEAEFSKTGFRLVAFLDGHVEAINEADWKELLKLNGM